MRLVSWNCRSGFHRKLEVLAALAPDVAVVAECANLDVLAQKAPDFAPTSSEWVGNNPNRGLGVFSFGGYRLVRRGAHTADPLATFALPLRVEGPNAFNLLALWVHHGLAGTRVTEPGPTLRALAAYHRADSPWIVAGDLNNHVRWDKPGKAWNHANTVTACAQLGLVSAYHAFFGLEQGAEDHPTFYWRTRSEDGPTYHIDYVFVPLDSVGLLRSVAVGTRAEWIATRLSDHAPVIVDLDPTFST